MSRKSGFTDRLAPDGDDTMIVFESLADYRPSLARRVAPSVDLP